MLSVVGSLPSWALERIFSNPCTWCNGGIKIPSKGLKRTCMDGKNCSRKWWHWWVVKICMLSRLSLGCISFLSLAFFAATVWQIFVGLSQVNNKKMSQVIDTIEKWKSSTRWTRHGLLFCPPPQWYSQAWSFVIFFYCMTNVPLNKYYGIGQAPAHYVG